MRLHCMLCVDVCLLHNIIAFAPFAACVCLSVAMHECMTCPQEAPGLTSKYLENSTLHCAGFIGPVDQLQHVRCISLSLTMLHRKLSTTRLLPDLQFWYTLK